MKISTILVDDEFHARALMRKLLEIHVPQVVVVGDADSAESGIRLIKKKRPELVFLDIEMMGHNGFEMLDLINEVNFEVVFVTAHEQYALKAFKYDVVDYLLKPVDIKELKKTMDKIKLSIDKKRMEKSDQKVNEYVSMNYQKIALPSQEGIRFVDVKNIIRMEADGSYVTIYSTLDKPHVVSKPLGYYAKILNENVFVRVHRSHLVNVKRVVEFKKGNHAHVILDNGDIIQVAASKRELFSTDLI